MNPKILAIETSTEMCSIALSDGQQSRVLEENLGQRHTERVMFIVDDILRDASLSLTELDALAIGAGPGSFTGVRTACALAQGLALGADLPVVLVPSIEAVAHQVDATNIVVCLDARMSQVYVGFYEKRGERCVQVGDLAVQDPDKVQLPDGSTWVGCGSGFSVYREELQMRFGDDLSSIMASVVYPSAEAVLTIAIRKFLNGEIVSPEDALPIYVRDKVAKTLDEQAASKRV